MPLDPDVQAMLDELAGAGFPGLASMTPERARAFASGMAASLPPGPALPSVADTTIPGSAGPVPIRVYTPEGTAPFPVVLYFHGGGWVFGDLDLSDAHVRQLAKDAGCLVVSVAYRLAPEHPFPAALDDCWSATTWVAAHAEELGGDGSRVIVADDSAGANLAAVVARRARDRGEPRLCYQVLLCPVLDHDLDRRSYRENAEGFLLTRADMAWFWAHYVPDESRRSHPDASPLRAESLAGLPPANIVTAEFDPLRDEGDAYAARLAEAGVAVAHACYPGVIHGFCVTNVFARGREAARDVTRRLRAATG
jgi:acetyl esterase